MSDLIEFTIKNPANVTSSPFKVRAKLSSTVQDLKEIICRECDGQPDTQSQTLIYAGKVLRDGSVLVKDFIHQNLDASASHSLHLVVKVGVAAASQLQPQQAQPVPPAPSSSGSSQRVPPPQVHVPTQLQPQNAAMMAAYQAALNAFMSNQPMRPGVSTQPAAQAGQSHEAAARSHPHQQQPPQAQHQQQQHQPHAGSQQAGAPASSQPAMYPVHPPHMLAYVPMLVPNPYAALPQAWAQHQQGQPAQQQGQAGQAPQMAPYPNPYPYPPGMPFMFPYGVPQQQGPLPIRVHLPGGAFPGMPAAGHNAGMRGGGGRAQGMAGGMFRMRRVPGMQVRMVRIDLKALLQVAVAAWVLYQHCPPGRFLMLAAVAGLIYLTGLTPLRQMLQRLANANLPQPARPAAAVAGPNQAAPAAPHQWTFLAELQAVVVGFISSLIPGWNMNAEDAAAFAAAQQMQAAEAAREAQQARANEQPNLHQD